MTYGTSGPTSRRQFAIYDPDTSSWRMWPDIGLWGSVPYSQTWPASGMTRNGAAYELPTSAPHTGGNGSSSLLPTPAVNDMGDGKTVEWWDEWTAKAKAKHGNGNGHGNSLAIEVQRTSLLPTPRATDWKDMMHAPASLTHAEVGKGTLSEVLGLHMLPTPRASDGTKGGPNQRGSSGDLMLPSAVLDL